MLSLPVQDLLPAGWLAFAGRESNPLDRDERFPGCYISSPLPGFTLTLPNAISVVLPCVPGPLLQLLPRCRLPFLPLGHWPSPSEHGSALGFAPPLLLRMVKFFFGAAVIPLRSGPQVCSPHR